MAQQAETTTHNYENFSNEAKNTLTAQLYEYEEYLIKEARRIEEGERENNATQEITSSHIIQAARRSKISRPKKHGSLLVFLKLLSAFTGVTTGALLDSSKFAEAPWRFPVLLISLVVFIVSTLMHLILEGRDQ